MGSKNQAATYTTNKIAKPTWVGILWIATFLDVDQLAHLNHNSLIIVKLQVGSSNYQARSAK